MRTITRFLMAGFALSVIAGCGSNVTTPQRPSSPVSWRANVGASTQQEALQGLQFYPKSITVNAGDTITWTFPSNEPHTVTFPVLGQAPPPPAFPSVQMPAGSKTYDGSTYTSSGFVLHGGTYSLTFPKPGTYPFYCLIHGPEMQGTVIVHAAGSPYPTAQSQYDAQAQSASAADLASAAAALTAFPYPVGGPHLAAGIAPGLNAAPPATSTVVRFMDAPSATANSVTISLGTTVTWTNLSNNFPHTVTFAIAGQPLPANMSPFSPPSGGTTYDGSTLTNSGVLRPGQSYSLTFTARGTFQYNCLFHDDTENMIGTVVVQ